MSALTKNERDGLDEVFLSIHTHTDKNKRNISFVYVTKA